jgi:catechol 2,3-dioxygenase-like lactoylglutathione lyase family enzyme
MFDHVTVRVPDLPASEHLFQTMLDPLALDQTLSTRTFALWDDFALASPDDVTPLTHRAHVALVAPSQEAVREFWQAGVDGGLRDDGPPGPRPQYGEDYYGAFLRDAQDNSFEAVHRAGHRRGGNVDHVAIRVADLAAACVFYRTIGPAAGFDAGDETAEHASFNGRADGGLLLLVAGPPTEHLHIAFPGDDAAVERFHADGTAAGFRSNGEPGERPRYHTGYYASYLLDPDGNNLEVVNHHRP